MCQGVAIFVLFDISTNIWHVHASEEIFYFLKFKYYTLKVHFSNKTKNVHNLFFDTPPRRSWRALNEGLHLRLPNFISRIFTFFLVRILFWFSSFLNSFAFTVAKETVMSFPKT